MQLNSSHLLCFCYYLFPCVKHKIKREKVNVGGFCLSLFHSVYFWVGVSKYLLLTELHSCLSRLSLRPCLSACFFFFFFSLDLGLPCSCHLDRSSRICNFLETKEVYGLCRRKARALTSTGRYAAAWFFLRHLSDPKMLEKTRQRASGQHVADQAWLTSLFLWMLWEPFVWVIFQTRKHNFRKGGRNY